MNALYQSVTNGPHDTVTAADGSAELLIPNGALPSGTSAADISIAKADASTLDLTVGGAGPIAAWTLSPDGLVFAQPVIFHVKSDTRPAGTSAAFVSVSAHSEAVESLSSLSISDPTATPQSMAVVSHFSDIAELNLSITTTLRAPSTAVVGVTERAYAHIAASGLPSGTTAGATWLSTDPIRLVGDGQGFEGAITDAADDSTGFVCTAEDPATIRYGVRFTIVRTATHQGQSEDDAFDMRTLTSVGVTCVDVATPGPSPTPTLAGTPPPPSAPPASYVPPVSVALPLLPRPFGSNNFAGGVQITANADGTLTVVVNPQGPQGTLPVTINKGGCNNPGTVASSLSDATNGASTTTIDQTFASLFTGGFSINVAPQGSTKSFLCADVPKATEIQLGAGAAGDETPATAILTDFGSMVGVYIDKTLGQSPTGQPANIVSAACPATGQVAYPLSDVQNGVSHSTIATTLDKLLKGGYSIQVGASDASPDQIVVCGDLK